MFESNVRSGVAKRFDLTEQRKEKMVCTCTRDDAHSNDYQPVDLSGSTEMPPWPSASLLALQVLGLVVTLTS